MVFPVLILLRPVQGTCMWLHPEVLIYTCAQSDGSFGELTVLPSPPLAAAHVPPRGQHTAQNTGRRLLTRGLLLHCLHLSWASHGFLQHPPPAERALSSTRAITEAGSPLWTALDSCPGAAFCSECACSGPVAGHGPTSYSASSLDGSQTTFLRSRFQRRSVTHSFTWHPRGRIPRSRTGEAGSDFALSDGVWGSVLLGPDCS